MNDHSTIENVFRLSLAIALPIAMGLLGMQVSTGELRQAIREPRAVAAGLFCKLVLLPALAFLFMMFYPVSVPLKVGIVIIAATPCGAVSNVITFMGRGNLPLAMLLTLITSLLAVVTLPLVVDGGLMLLRYDAVAHLPVLPMIARSIVLVLIPVIVGAAVRAKYPKFVERLERPTERIIGALVLFLTVFGIYSQWALFRDNFNLLVVGGPAIFSVTLLLGAFYAGRLFGLSPRDRFTVAIETVVTNAVLALLIAAFLEVPEANVFVAFFGTFSIIAGAASTRVLRAGGSLNRDSSIGELRREPTVPTG